MTIQKVDLFEKSNQKIFPFEKYIDKDGYPKTPPPTETT